MIEVVKKIDGKPVYPMFIDSQWDYSDTRTTVAVINPADETIVAWVQKGTRNDADRALAAAERAQPAWAATPARDRADIMNEFAALIVASSERLVGA